MNVYCVFDSLDYEGSDLVSIHNSLESANSKAEAYFYDKLRRWYCYQDEAKTLIRDNGTFAGRFSDTDVSVKVYELEE